MTLMDLGRGDLIMTQPCTMLRDQQACWRLPSYTCRKMINWATCLDPEGFPVQLRGIYTWKALALPLDVSYSQTERNKDLEFINLHDTHR